MALGTIEGAVRSGEQAAEAAIVTLSEAAACRGRSRSRSYCMIPCPPAQRPVESVTSPVMSRAPR